ncbi:hypothetical protein Krad_2763 [Kineococcus radiotolerans SRS30216 = ATCC BAA-149]|uniref:Uncharacterized protein n=1 Tax=Kineococcus radiotolerans (strain ATCC BAA-149 / DSM 14245 / SRS30216) TaxID=266940 RepID=A6WBP5_KINRD|nr:hypothetical protein Krad_2763 [Kineococcus radiotolerans SRS30216 = ATCC BAA-149]
MTVPHQDIGDTSSGLGGDTSLLPGCRTSSTAGAVSGSPAPPRLHGQRRHGHDDDQKITGSPENRMGSCSAVVVDSPVITASGEVGVDGPPGTSRVHDHPVHGARGSCAALCSTHRGDVGAVSSRVLDAGGVPEVFRGAALGPASPCLEGGGAGCQRRVAAR